MDFNPFTATTNFINNRDHTNIRCIKKKFKKLLKSVGKRNIDDVREDLLSTLIDYKDAKTTEFINAKNLLSKSNREIEHTITNIMAQKEISESEINLLKKHYDVNKSDIILQKGILKASAIDKYNKILLSLNDSQKNILEKLNKLNEEIELFTSKYELKRAEINLMLVGNVVDSNFSTVDLNLDDLIIEYQDKENELKNAREIRTKMNNVPEKEETIEDKEKYKEMFLNYNA